MNTIPLSSEFMRGLREAEATYRHLVEGTPAILYIDAADDLSSNLYTSPQIERILGFSVREWREDPGLWLARMHPDDRDRVVPLHHESNRTGRPFAAEYRLLARDGAERWFRDEAVIVRNDRGEALFWRGIMLDVTDQKRTEEKLRQSLDILRRTMTERRVLLQRLDDAQEEERRRIASGIHDDSIQVISAADLRLQAARTLVESEEAREELGTVHEALKLAVDGLRHLLFELRPPVLDREGLVVALREYLSAGDVAFDIRDSMEGEPPIELRVALFRIAQEAVTNIRKHARASRIELTLEPRDGGIGMRVADDGVGFDRSVLGEPRPGHIGVPTMLERAEMVGGRCAVDSRPGAGTVVECWVPLPDLRPVADTA